MCISGNRRSASRQKSSNQLKFDQEAPNVKRSYQRTSLNKQKVKKLTSKANRNLNLTNSNKQKLIQDSNFNPCSDVTELVEVEDTTGGTDQQFLKQSFNSTLRGDLSPFKKQHQKELLASSFANSQNLPHNLSS